MYESYLGFPFPYDSYKQVSCSYDVDDVDDMDDGFMSTLAYARGDMCVLVDMDVAVEICMWMSLCVCVCFVCVFCDVDCVCMAYDIGV